MPSVGRVMCRKTVAAIEFLGRGATVGQQLVAEIKERLMTFGEVEHFRNPIVHLNIDVDVVVRIPTRRDPFYPDPLKIGGHRSRKWVVGSDC